MMTFAGYQITETLYESSNSLVYRGHRETDGRPVVLKVLKEAHPSPERIAWFRREYERTYHLNPSPNSGQALQGVVEAYDLITEQQRWVMVLEDFGGESLERLKVAGQLALTDFLTLAIAVTDILDQIHQRYIIHKDINPSNIVLNLRTGQIKIIDFGISTTLLQETPTFRNPNVLEGTLAYISPEQTGRMNRAIDYRTDFYSLGVTFYELLTGQVPFPTTDLLEVVHSHIAKLPPLPQDLKPDIPQPLSEIVLKLLAKNAESRYQSSRGLKADLEECLRQWRAVGRINPFPLGQNDISDRFQIPQKLYGREQETETLLAAFERVSQGASEMMLVTGYAGIGKSALVQEMYKPITRQRSYFITGKFDQFQRNIPYSSIIQAFRSLIRQLLTESEAEIVTWRDKLLAVLVPNGQVIIEVIPEIELIIGQQPDVPTLPPEEAQNRFNLVFRNFIAIFTQPEHPLVIFLDDLQWADGASLKLLELLMTAEGSEYLFLIGAYRDNEVNEAHPLMLTLEKIKESKTKVSYISLSPLALPYATELVSDTLHQSSKEVRPLAELILAKTGGNPFFMNEFLKSLYTERLLTFSPPSEGQKKGNGWQWNLDQIQAQDITDNVVDLLASKVRQLPESTQQVLKLAACIGNQFDLETLAIVSEQSPSETAADLWAGITAGLILPLSDAYKLMELDMPGVTDEIKTEYKFAHDRIQQAVYSLIPKSDKQAVHRRIGQLLLKNTAPEDQEPKLFDIVNQLNLGQTLIDQQTELDRLAELNLLAGQKAKASAAYQPAFNYLKTGLGLLESPQPSLANKSRGSSTGFSGSIKLDGEDSWQRQYNLTLRLYQEASEAAYLSGEFEEMEQLAEVALQQAKTPLDKAQIYKVKIQAYMAQRKLLEAIEMALQALKLLGIVFPERPSQEDIIRGSQETKLTWEGRQIEHLIELPKMTDPVKLAAMQILLVAEAPSYIARPDLSPLMMFKRVNLSVEFGNAAEAISGYAYYGTLLCGSIEDIDSGYRFGQLALRLLEQFNANEYKARIYLLVNHFLRPWKEPIREILSPLLEGYRSGLEMGELEFGALNIVTFCVDSYLAGRELIEVEREMTRYGETVVQLKQEAFLHWLQIYWQSVLNLMGRTENPYHLSGEAYNEEKMLPLHLESNDNSALFNVYLNKLMLCYLFQAFPQAVENLNKAEEHLINATGSLLVPIFYFYDSLIRLAVFPEISGTEQKDVVEKVTINQEKMKIWAELAPMNWLHKFYLVEAERARILGNDSEARDYYDKAIELAQENEYLNEESLAYELAARFYLEKGQTRLARYYMRDAHYAYQRWGAVAKVKDLEKRYPQLLAPVETRPSGLTTTITTTSTETRSTSALDLASVLKASQTISGEIMLDALLAKMMKIVVENAGAEKGLLILEKGGRWGIEAEGRVDQAEVTTRQAIPAAPPQSPPEGGKRDAQPRRGTKEETPGGAKGGDSLLPTSIINYVARTQENVVLNDAGHEGAFSQDDYIVTQQPKSVLCMPLINQAKLIGLLYLENNLTTGAFTEDRIEVLSLLSSQAAVSLENARLYDNLATSEQRFRTLFENAPLCVFEVDLDQTPSVILAANRQAELVYGWSAEELAAQPAEQLVPPEAMAEVDQMVARVQAGETVSLETSTRRRDGTVFPVRLSATPEKGPGLSRMIVTVEDITLEKERRFEAEAIDEERRRIAHEIHDGLAQDLAALRFKTTLWHDLVDADPAKMHDELDLLQETLNGSIREVRRSIFALRPIALDELGFFPALHQFTTHFGEQYELQVRLRIDGLEERLPATLELPLFRVIQEALNNIGKHAQANVVQINLELASPEAITLTVRDDGVGFDPAKLNQRVREGHVGLKQMRERVESINGSHSIQSQVGQGTEVRVVLPLSGL